jgi:hypothetical protein
MKNEINGELCGPRMGGKERRVDALQYRSAERSLQGCLEVPAPFLTCGLRRPSTDRRHVSLVLMPSTANAYHENTRLIFL